MKENFTIWLVEDDPVIAEKLAQALAQWSYRVVRAQHFDALIEEFSAVKPDLVILDLMLPAENGFVVCQNIRLQSAVPILFLSSRTENVDRILAMQVGADDYMTKPVDMTLLAAKVNAILRRAYQLKMQGNKLHFGAAGLDPDRLSLEGPSGTVMLSSTEYLILNSLFRAQGAIVSRDTLMEACWKGDDFIDDNTLAVNMTRIRKKGSEVGLDDLIRTQRGVGYGLIEERDNDLA